MSWSAGKSCHHLLEVIIDLVGLQIKQGNVPYERVYRLHTVEILEVIPGINKLRKREPFGSYEVMLSSAVGPSGRLMKTIAFGVT